MTAFRLALWALAIQMFALFTCRASFAQATPSNGPYLITDLGTLGGSKSDAAAISDTADVAGTSMTGSGSRHAFLFQGGRLIDLGTLGGLTSGSNGINHAGAVVGAAATPSGRSHAFVYRGGSLVDLGTLGGSTSTATSINNLGDIVGSSLIAGDGATHAFLYRNGRMADLGVAFGGTQTVATAINSSGDVTGYGTTAGNTSRRAFLYSAGATTDIGSLGGATEATALNDGAEVVGRGWVAGDSVYHAFLYSGGAIADLGTLGGANSEALGINAWRQVVGSAQLKGTSTWHAFIFENGHIIDLNSMITSSGWVLSSARAINDAGEVVGVGLFNGVPHAFRLTPPVSLTLDNFGGLTSQDSNIPQFGVQTGRSVMFVMTVGVVNGVARDTVLTDTVSGSVEITNATSERGAPCSFSGRVVTCNIADFSDAFYGDEIHVTVRTTAAGPFSHTAQLTASNGVNAPSESESNTAVSLAGLSLSASTVAGGKSVSTTVTITAGAPSSGAVITLTSSNPAIATVPSNFSVFPGTTSKPFNIVPKVVSQPTNVVITATYGLITISKTLTVVPPVVSAFSLSRSTIIAPCQTAVGKVTLTGWAPTGGAVVVLTNTNAMASMPTSVTVPSGARSVSFNVSPKAVTAFTSGTVTASYGGGSKTLSLAVRPTYVKSVVVNPSTVTGGGSSIATATIECSAPTGGKALTLSSSNTAVAHPTVSVVTIPAGTSAGSFTVATAKVAALSTVSIRAAVSGNTKSAGLTVTP